MTIEELIETQRHYDLGNKWTIRKNLSIVLVGSNGGLHCPILDCALRLLTLDY